MALTKLASINITPGTYASWVTVDLSSYVASGTTGVWLYFSHVQFNGYAFGARHPSDTGNRISHAHNNSGQHVFVGVNASRQVQIYIQGADYTVALEGAFGSESSFQTSGVDITPTTGSWQTVALSAYSPGQFAIIEYTNAGNTNGTGGFTHGDSSDTVTYLIGPHTWAIVPVNTSKQIRVYAPAGVNNSVFYHGSIDSGATIVNPIVDVSLTVATTWTAINPQSGTPTFAIVNSRASHTADSTGATIGLRKATGATTYQARPVAWHTAIVECNASGQFEAYVTDLTSDTFVVGELGNALATIYEISVLDGILFDDGSPVDQQKIILDNLFIDSPITAVTILEYNITGIDGILIDENQYKDSAKYIFDTLLMSDYNVSDVAKFMLDSLLVGSLDIRDLSKMYIDYLVTSDEITVQQITSGLFEVAIIDSLFFNDSRSIELDKILIDFLLADDEQKTSLVREILTVDNLMLYDEITKALYRAVIEYIVRIRSGTNTNFLGIKLGVMR